MRNLLEETRNRIHKLGMDLNDVEYCIIPDSKDVISFDDNDLGEYHQGCWEEFALWADDIEYDAGYGGHEIPMKTAIVFADHTYLTRGEYDGSEWWDYNEIPTAKEH